MGVLDKYSDEIDSTLKELPVDLPAGVYIGRVEAMEDQEGPANGKPFILWKIRVTEGRDKGSIAQLRSYFHTPGAAGMSARNFARAGVAIKSKADLVEAMKTLTGRYVEFSVQHNDRGTNLSIQKDLSAPGAEPSKEAQQGTPLPAPLTDEDLPF